MTEKQKRTWAGKGKLNAEALDMLPLPRLDNIEDVKQLKGKKIPTFSRSTYIIDQTLNPVIKNNNKVIQANIFDSLNEPTKNKILSKFGNEETAIEWVNNNGVGFNPSASERFLILSISQLLHEKSHNTTDKRRADYYRGNTGELKDLIYSDGRQIAALKFTAFELAKIYTGKKNPAGKEISTVWEIVKRISYKEEKKILFKYQKEVEIDGKKFIKTLDSYGHLWTIVNETLESAEKPTDIVKETYIKLHPIFIDELSKMWVDTPLDIIPRLKEGYKDVVKNKPNSRTNGSKVPDVVLSLFERLNKEFSQAHFVFKIGLNTLSNGTPGLYHVIGKTYLEESRKKLLEERFKDAVDTMINIELVLDFKIEKSPTSGDMAVFILNENWLKVKEKK